MSTWADKQTEAATRHYCLACRFYSDPTRIAGARCTAAEPPVWANKSAVTGLRDRGVNWATSCPGFEMSEAFAPLANHGVAFAEALRSVAL